MKILVCPLNWGLGHATRCIPIIQDLIKKGHEPVLASDAYPLEFLRLQFPSLRTIQFPGYSIRYSKGKSQVLIMLMYLPSFIFGIYKEHLWVKNLLKQEKFDQLISDNRFGLWNKDLHTIYITHQLMIKMPLALKFLEPLIWLLHRFFINRYNECWIPDIEGDKNISGDLAHKFPLPKNAKFIGLLSRFMEVKNIIPNNKFEIVGMVSGVEPQRTAFQDYLVQRFENSESKVLIICGKPTPVINFEQRGNISIYSHMPDIELAGILVGAKKIISRSGYSTIMDLESLNCLSKAEFIPTPGQTEQEYLKKITM